jgi:hypothetical protein
MINRIAVVGNCQADTLARFIRVLYPVAHVQLFSHGDAGSKEKRSANEAMLAQADLVFSQPLRSEAFGGFSYERLSANKKTHFFPPFSFAGFHPDCVYIGIAKALSNTSPVGDYSSSIAVFSYLNGLSPDETMLMFNDTVYRKLGFFDIWDKSKEALVASFRKSELDISAMFDGWSKSGVFMHTINHPHSFVMADIAKLLLAKAGLQGIATNAVKYVSDKGAEDIVWPVYPGIAENLGANGEMMFKVSDRYAPADKRPYVIDLKTFIEGSFKRYEKMDRASLICRSICKSHEESMDIVAELATRLKQQGKSAFGIEAAQPSGSNPYKQLPPHQFWRKAISTVPAVEVDPVVSMPFKITSSDKVATAGSCFAQHIAARLQTRGFNYFVSETPPPAMSGDEAKERNFGVFSARYGNVYTTRQLLQLFDRAYGHFEPVDTAWAHPRSGFVDPFRPQIEPRGFASRQDVEQSRAEHLAAVRTLFETADLFVFTLGLTEGWRSRRDGAVFPLAPGVAGGTFDPDAYEFVNFTAEEVTADLVAFVKKLREVNGRCRVLLTVSPVPLIATYESRHVLVSTNYSKSVLRVAAETACNTLQNVHYFPSYDIIISHYNKGAYFEEDMRSVSPEGVDHVMGLFFKHLTECPDEPTVAPDKSRGDQSFSERMNALNEVVCDEEAIVR